MNLKSQFSWKFSFLLCLVLSSPALSKPLPNIKATKENITNGPYALRLVSNNSELTNIYFTTDVSFRQNPALTNIQPVWGGATWLQSPNSYDPATGGSLFLDDRLDNYNSPQLTLQYAKGSDELVPFLNWAWESGPGTTHVWPAHYYVTWGSFAFVRQQDSGKLYLTNKGTQSVENGWRWAAEYEAGLKNWYMKNFNATDPRVSLPKAWEYVNIEAVPFQELDTLAI